MSHVRDMLAVASELAESGTAYVMLTVIDARGRTPRDVGARMLLTAEGAQIGTIGGGGFEQLALESAERHLAARSHGREEFVLGEEAEQCCGGVMEVLYEYVGPAARVVIFGAGHVALELAELLEDAPVSVVVADDRAEWLDGERFDGAELVDSFEEGVERALEDPARTLCCVMTYSHDVDLEIVAELLKHDCAYTGLIGSSSKRACFVSRLQERGIGEAHIGRMECPMGLGDMGKTPRQVAMSIAGRLYLEARALSRAE